MQAFWGRQPNKLLAALRDEWLSGNRSVCLVEGFPGIGKTELAERLMAMSGWNSIYVECPEGGTDVTSDLLAHLGERLASAGYLAMADANGDHRAQLTALAHILANKVLIVIDEFQNCFVGRTGKPSEALEKSLESISRDPRCVGRVLLLSNRSIERARWSERFENHQFPEMERDEGISLLVDLLDQCGRLDDIPPPRRIDVVEALGRNPRAIATLVHCLSDEPLDDLLDSAHEAWVAEDRKFSAELARRLEVQIVKRAVGHLPHDALVFLRRLSVHRLALRRQGLEQMMMSGTDPTLLVSDLSQRFLLTQRVGFYHIHPIVRAISRERWSAESREIVNAHSAAADFYARPFKAKQLLISGRTGGQFAELRYHLTKSGRAANLAEYRSRIIAEISQQWHATTRLPSDVTERDDQITLLSSVLIAPGPKALESYLTRLLCARNAAKDVDLASVHAKRATNAEIYQICAELLAASGKLEDAIALLKEGIAKIPPDKSLFSLYQSCGEMLAAAGQREEAIALLKDGIAKIPPDKNLVSLYQSCGVMLAAAGRREDAIALLKDGIAKIPPEHNLFSLYQSCGEMLTATGQREEAIALLKDGIAKIPPEKGLFSLYQSCGVMLTTAGRREEAIALLKNGIAKIPPEYNLVSLYQSCGEILAAAGRREEAIALLKDGIAKIPPDKNVFLLYQNYAGLLAKVADHYEKLKALLVEGIRAVPAEQGGNRLVETLLLNAARVGDMTMLQNLQAIVGDRPISEVQLAVAKSLVCEIQGNFEQAALEAAEGRRIRPTYLALAMQEAFCWLCAKQPDKAEAALLRFPSSIFGGKNNSIDWLRTFIALAQGRSDIARRYFELFLGHPVSESETSLENMLRRIWLDDLREIGGSHVAYYFRQVPHSIADLRHPLPAAENGASPAQPAPDPPPAENLDAAIRQTLGQAYFADRPDDAEYQIAFENAGKEKARHVLATASRMKSDPLARFAYVSIGGADGSEVDWAMRNSDICHGVMLEFGTAAAAKARLRIPVLAANGKKLVVIEGDATQKLGEVTAVLQHWRNENRIEGIVVSAQSVLHELPYRSPAYRETEFFGQLFNNWDSVVFCSREPCAPQNWPPTVQMKLKNVRADTLAAVAKHIAAHLRFEGKITPVARDLVEMSSELALETLFKVLYLDSTFSYEMTERLSAFDPGKTARVIGHYLNETTVQTDYTVSDHFRTEYQRTVEAVYNADTLATLGMPNSFARIVGAK